MSDIKIAIAGASGRMGQALIRAVLQTPNTRLTGALVRTDNSNLGQDVGSLLGAGVLGVVFTDNPQTIDCDVWIDFSNPDLTLSLSQLCAQKKCAHIIGTTGLNESQKEIIAQNAKQTAVVMSGNMSLGVNLLAALTKKVAQSLDETFDIEIVEAHHNKKVDAPSGTALLLGDAAAKGRGITLSGHSERARDGLTGERKKGAIGFASLRGGTIVGEHTVLFAGPMERIELTHKAEDRSIFARGALKAALWVKGKVPNLYDMQDVLNLK